MVMVFPLKMAEWLKDFAIFNKQFTIYKENVLYSY